MWTHPSCIPSREQFLKSPWRWIGFFPPVFPQQTERKRSVLLSLLQFMCCGQESASLFNVTADCGYQVLQKLSVVTLFRIPSPTPVGFLAGEVVLGFQNRTSEQSCSFFRDVWFFKCVTRPESLLPSGVLEGSFMSPLNSEGPKAHEPSAGASGEGEDGHVPLPGRWWEEIQPEV